MLYEKELENGSPEKWTKEKLFKYLVIRFFVGPLPMTGVGSFAALTFMFLTWIRRVSGYLEVQDLSGNGRSPTAEILNQCPSIKIL